MNTWTFDPVSTANGTPTAWMVGEPMLIAMFDRNGKFTLCTAEHASFNELDPLDGIMQVVYTTEFPTQHSAMEWFKTIKHANNVIAAAYASGRHADSLHSNATIRIVVDNWNAVLVLNVQVLNANGQTIQVKSGHGRKAFIRRDNIRKENGYYLVKGDGSFTFRSMMADGLCYSTISEAIR